LMEIWLNEVYDNILGLLLEVFGHNEKDHMISYWSYLQLLSFH